MVRARLRAGPRRQRRLVRHGADRAPAPCRPRIEHQLGRSHPVCRAHIRVLSPLDCLAVGATPSSKHSTLRTNGPDQPCTGASAFRCFINNRDRDDPHESRRDVSASLEPLQQVADLLGEVRAFRGVRRVTLCAEILDRDRVRRAFGPVATLRFPQCLTLPALPGSCVWPPPWSAGMPPSG